MEKKNAHKISVGKSEGKKSYLRPGHRRKSVEY
jgi:hypothetical protein